MDPTLPGKEVLISALLALISAQLVKAFIDTVTHQRLNFRIMVQTGGMPSSHSAFMASMATSCGLVEGFGSTQFAIALSLALIVMYDAAGVRRAAGKMAGILNKITEDFYMHYPALLPERLRELLGHTPIEVVVGALFGTAMACFVHSRLL
ncbi:MAG: divergent PAP2 family protein [Cyanobacteria bacterium]|nr:divergent PAP2 family protein [Cyanobacteriota bacterium]